MGILSEPFRDFVTYAGKRYQTNAAYDTVLLVQRMYKDPELENADKIEIALENLLAQDYRIHGKSLQWKAGLLEAIMKSQIELPQRPSAGAQKRLVDFELDGEYIYASFLQDYGLDLIEQKGKLHWKKFIWLFQGLSEKTKIKEIMRIRGTEEPRPNQYNQKEIQRIRELKSYYALPVEGGGGRDGLNRLFHALEAQAVKV